MGRLARSVVAEFESALFLECPIARGVNRELTRALELMRTLRLYILTLLTWYRLVLLVENKAMKTPCRRRRYHLSCPFRRPRR